MAGARGSFGRRARWIGGLVGLAALLALIGAVAARDEGARLLDVLGRAEPAWLALAVGLQAATYAMEAGAWGLVLARAGAPVRFGTLYALSIAALFTNQAVPVAGLAGTVLVIDALAVLGAERTAAVAAVMVDEVGYLVAYALAIAAGVAVLRAHHGLSLAVLGASAAALAVGLAIAGGVMWLAAAPRRLPAAASRWPALERALRLLLDADRRLVRDPRLLLGAASLRVGNFLLDALTLWACLRAVGQPLSAGAAGSAFVVASLARSIGVVPGGLGTFEAAAIGGLALFGVRIEPALAAVLLFRGLSFWLPMGPGLWLARRLSRSAPPPLPEPVEACWAEPPDVVLAALRSGPAGLDGTEVAARLAARPRPRRRGHGIGRILAAQFLHPLVLILLVAAAISFPVGSVTDGGVILAIVVLSGGLGFFQEYTAADTVAKLLGRIRTTATVRRGGALTAVPVEEIVPGDVVLLSAGATVPGDGRILSSNGLQIDESALTGESFPAEKRDVLVPADASLMERSSAVFQGTHVVSGAAEVVVAATGDDTEIGRIRRRLEHRRPPTEFDLGIQRFGNLLVRVSAILVIAIFGVHLLLARPALDAFLFSVALAVGLVPEMLPAIVTVNLARGARQMAHAGVIVKRLPAIEELGAVDLLCCDKTGTLTEGRVRLHGAFGVDGASSEAVLVLGWLNATFESGYANPIDEALRGAHAGDGSGWVRVGEVPYDFLRRRLTVVLERGGERLAIAKGQLGAILSVCTAAEGPGGAVAPLDEVRESVTALHARLAEAGMRTLGVAVRSLPAGMEVSPAIEEGMRLCGILALSDPPRSDVRSVLDRLDGLGISFSVVTGDDRRVAAHVWRELRGRDPVLLTGSELRTLGPEALARRAPGVDVFAEVEPAQKERIVMALRAAGRVVGFLGDGINDAPALRAADVGLTVDGAADVAREAADVVLCRPDLAVLADGVREGRRTLANSLKYVYYTTSANFGNMLSMAVASAFLPFLPLLPKQILLNNFLSDLPALTIAADRVDEAQLARPGRWRTVDIRRFMILFGTISSAFDLATFVALMALYGDHPGRFRSGWFVESLLTEILVLFVLRSRLPIGRSRPASAVVWTTAAVGLVALALPFVPIGRMFSLEPLPVEGLAALVAITLAYLTATELAKRWFFRGPAVQGPPPG